MPSFGTVIFDCDSTLSTIEGIEDLAADRADEIARLTQLAMDGQVPLEEVYGLRIEQVRPSRQRVERLGHRYIETMVADVPRVVRDLMAAGIDVRIVSGGLKPAILILAAHLGIRPEAVAAVDVVFGPDGSYAGFDAQSPLTTAGGKRRVIEAWKPSLRAPVMLVGDGATDLEAKPAVDMFVAYTGVKDRATIRRRADVVIEGPSLLPVVKLALGTVTRTEGTSA